MLRTALAVSVAVLTLTLAACDDGNQTAQNQEPAQSAPNQPAPEPTPQDRVNDAGRQLRDAARDAGQAAREGANALIEQGREALKDAGPALDRAGEAARQLSQSLDEIMARARRDFDSGVAELQKRIDEARGTPAAPTGDPAATLPSADRLKADTRAAARARPAGVGPAYVGVWAADAASCGRVDVEPLEMFAVITPTTIRRYESVCNFAASDMTGDSATVNASCIAEGDVEERQVELRMAGEDRLAISTPGQAGAADLVRCHLPN